MDPSWEINNTTGSRLTFSICVPASRLHCVERVRYSYVWASKPYNKLVVVDMGLSIWTNPLGVAINSNKYIIKSYSCIYVCVYEFIYIYTFPYSYEDIWGVYTYTFIRYIPCVSVRWTKPLPTTDRKRKGNNNKQQQQQQQVIQGDHVMNSFGCVKLI